MTRVEFFNLLINILDKNNVRYAITGRTEGYPFSIESDIDIVVPREQINLIRTSLWRIEDEDTKIVQMFQHECVAFYYVIYHIKNNQVIYIQPDICTDYYRKGRKLLSAIYLLDGSRKAQQGEFYILAPEKEFIYYLLKKIDKQAISDEQFAHLRNSYLQDKDIAITESKKFWKCDDVDIIRKSFDTNNINLLREHIKELQASIHASKKRNIADYLRNIKLKIKRILNPTGYTVAIMGPDGSGKTTVINQLTQDIGHCFRRIQQFHLFPIPQKDSNIVNVDPHGKKKRGLVLSLMKLIYLAWIYVSGHIKYVLPKKIRSTLTIFDRYYDDIIIDPIRYRNGAPNWIVKCIRAIIPEPDLWIILDCATEVIQARKAEVTKEETERQRIAYIELAKTKKNCIILDTNRDVNKISAEACKFICNSLHKRAVKRYK